jgi:hypothetical protein
MTAEELMNLTQERIEDLLEAYRDFPGRNDSSVRSPAFFILYAEDASEKCIATGALSELDFTEMLSAFFQTNPKYIGPAKRAIILADSDNPLAQQLRRLISED